MWNSLICSVIKFLYNYFTKKFFRTAIIYYVSLLVYRSLKEKIDCCNNLDNKIWHFYMAAATFLVYVALVYQNHVLTLWIS